MAHYCNGPYFIIMKKTVKTALLVFVSIYWMMTFLYNSPNNYLKIELEKEIRIFATLFGQKWSFFAPPPQQNYKLYFSYLDEHKNEVAAFEVFSSIIESKKKTRPFNLRAEMVDYTIYGSVDDIVNSMIKKRDREKVKHPEMSTDESNNFARQQIINSPEKINGYQMLKNYSKIISRENLTGAQLKQIKFVNIKINSEEIKKFSNRYSPKPNLEANIIDFNPYPL